jgi:RHS repeat-associated protein
MLTYAYDGMNRLTLKTVPASASGAAGYGVYYNYDVNGLQTYARFGSASGPGISTSYDGFGRVTSSSTTMDGTARTNSYQYDALGDRTRLSTSSGYVMNWTYDAGGAMTALIDGNNERLALIGYDAAGRRQSLTLTSAGASTASYGYDAVNRLTSLSHDLAGGTFDQSLTFGYNPASQMVTKTAANDGYASNTAYNVARPYSVNGLNQYTAAGGAAFTYDANGNLISDGTNSYVYDAENRLVSRSGGTTLGYDPNGRLWQVDGPSGVTRFVYDGDRLIEELNGAGAWLRLYAHGPGPDEPLVWYELTGGPVRRYLHADHQGSVIASNDDAGNVVGLAGYDAWGIPNSTSILNVGRFGYTGQAWIPELGMYYYKARIYSPTLGRFLQTDLVGYKDQVNLYAYVGNDPVDGRDPTGLAGQCDTGSRLTGASGGCMVADGYQGPAREEGARQGPGYAHHPASPATERLVHRVMADPSVRAAADDSWARSRGQNGKPSEKNEYGFWVRGTDGNYVPGNRVPGDGPQIDLGAIRAARQPGDFLFVHVHPFRIGEVWRGHRIESIGISGADRQVAIWTRSIVVSVARPEPFTGRGYWVDFTDDFRE